ncbi:MAG: sodium/proton-translocating pyrophosphatase, partial [Candidatus Latescibacterota bacterium]
MESWTTAAPFLGLAGLACSLFLYTYVKKGSVGTQEMAAISEAIHEGAMAFLKREYTILLVFVIAVFALLFAFIGDQTAYAFLAGAACSIAAGFTGMKAATHANVRTAQAANQQGQGPALMMAFSGGAVMGLSVASLGLLGVG